MRILFVGNFDIAGKYIAERMYKEGHRIIWHTEEPERTLWNRSLKGNVYRYAINYQKCSQIMKTESPDCLVFLTQEYRDAYDWSEGRMIGLSDFETEVLRAAASLGVKKILYLSSTEMKREELLNPALEKLRAGERLCRSVCEENNMQCLIVRSGIVYGEGECFNHGFVEHNLHRMLSGKKVMTQYAYGSQFDFIYGTDFADAIERLLAGDETGVHTVLSGNPVRLQEFYDRAIATLQYKYPVEYGVGERREALKESIPLKQLTGWMPFYLFEEKAEEVFLHYRQMYKEQEEKAGQKREKKSYPFWGPFVQNLLLFVLFLVFDYFSSDWSDLRFVDVKLLYVVVVALSFGMRQGLIAIALATGAYFIRMLSREIDVSYVLYSMDTWVPFIMYSIAGTIVGYLSDKKEDDLENKEEEFESLREKYSFLKTMYQEALNIKNQLQKQIMISKDSLGHIYEITEELDDTKPRTVMIRAVKVIEETMECSSVAIYIRNAQSSYGRLMACSGDIVKEMTGSINFKEYPEMEEVLLQNEIYVNTALLEGYPSFAMPVFEGEQIVAVVAIYNIAPGKYTIYYKNLFQTLILILRNWLVRAYVFQEENRSRMYYEGTNILKNKEFQEELASIVQASDELQYPFSLGHIRYDKEEMRFEEMAERLSKSIRATDIAGCNENGEIYIILLFVTPAARGYMEQRLEKAGFLVDWEN